MGAQPCVLCSAMSWPQKGCSSAGCVGSEQGKWPAREVKALPYEYPYLFHSLAVKTVGQDTDQNMS